MIASARKVTPAATAPESRNSRPSRTKTTPVVHSHHRKLIRTWERPHRLGASRAPRGAWFALGFDSGVARATHDGPKGVLPAHACGDARPTGGGRKFSFRPPRRRSIALPARTVIWRRIGPRR